MSLENQSYEFTLWKHEQVQPSWKTEWRFIKKIATEMTAQFINSIHSYLVQLKSLNKNYTYEQVNLYLYIYIKCIYIYKYIYIFCLMNQL